MLDLNELRFSAEELEAKNVKDLADRPNLTAAEMKERLDSGDIRQRFNILLNYLIDRDA